MRLKSHLFLGAGLCIALSSQAFAQDAANNAAGEDAGDEIVVTGIRGSLSSAAAIKRNSDSIVDAISTEDLGKFPDSNVRIIAAYSRRCD